MRSARLAIAVWIALLAAAPAASAARGDRADARAIAELTKRYHRDAVAQAPAVHRNVDRLYEPLCYEAFRHVPDDERLYGEALLLGFVYMFEAQIAPVKKVSAEYVAALDRLRLRDPTLRSGRAAKRRQTAILGRFWAPPEDICAQLDGWRRAGYPIEGVPPLREDPGWRSLEAGRQERDERLVRRAGRRLRALGVPRRVVRLWNGDVEPFEDDRPGIPIGDANGA